MWVDKCHVRGINFLFNIKKLGAFFNSIFQSQNVYFQILQLLNQTKRTYTQSLDTKVHFNPALGISHGTNVLILYKSLSLFLCVCRWCSSPYATWTNF